MQCRSIHITTPAILKKNLQDNQMKGFREGMIKGCIWSMTLRSYRLTYG